jgi:hypothetical protein
MSFIATLLEVVSFLVRNWKLVLVIAALSGAAYEGFHLKKAWDDKAALVAEASELKHRLATITLLQASDAAKAKADADKLEQLEATARETPKNASPCLDRGATLRLRSIK